MASLNRFTTPLATVDHTPIRLSHFSMGDMTMAVLTDDLPEELSRALPKVVGGFEGLGDFRVRAAEIKGDPPVVRVTFRQMKKPGASESGRSHYLLIWQPNESRFASTAAPTQTLRMVVDGGDAFDTSLEKLVSDLVRNISKK